MSYHAKGRSGVRKRRRAHLTVILKELEAPKAEKLKKVKVPQSLCLMLTVEPSVSLADMLEILEQFEWERLDE